MFTTRLDALTVPPICKNVGDLFTASNVYFKSVCEVDSLVNYAQADALCKANGMLLYDTTSTADSESILFAWGAQAHMTLDYLSFWLKGMGPDGCFGCDNGIAAPNWDMHTDFTCTDTNPVLCEFPNDLCE